MNFKGLNELLNEQKISIKDIMNIAHKFDQKDLNDEKELLAIIQELSKLVHKDLTDEEKKKMISMVKQTNLK